MIDIKLPSKKLPVEPLLEALPEYVVAMLGPKQCQEWVDRGISFIDADKIAVKYGYHPVEIWGSLWTTSDIHEDLYNAGVSVVEAIKTMGPIDLQSLIKATTVPTDYIRNVLQWVEEMGCIRMELVGPQRKKVFHYERDFDA